MRTLLSLVLSFSIIFSSVTPSFAQLLPKVSRASLKGLTRSGSEIIGQGVVSGSRISAGVSTAFARQQINNVFTKRQILPSDFYQVPSHLLPNRILSYPDPVLRAELLRSSFLTLSLGTVSSEEQIALGVGHFKANLATNTSIFKQLSQKEIGNLLFAYRTQDPVALQNASKISAVLTDATAIGLLGTVTDSPALLAFHKAAKNTPFENVAEVITARGLLRQGAYEELTQWAAGRTTKGSFWEGLAAYVEENHLPVEIEIVAGEKAMIPGMASFLAEQSEYLALHADWSANATARWMELGKTPVSPTEEANNVVATASTLNLPKIEISYPNLQANPVEVAPSAQEIASSRIIANSTNSVDRNIQHYMAPVAKGSFIARGFKYIRGLFGTNFQSMKATFVREGSVEKALPLDLEVFSTRNKLGSKDYDRVAFVFNPNFQNGYVAEFRNSHTPQTMEHFYLKMESNQVGDLVNLFVNSGQEGKLLLKLEKKANVEYKSIRLPVYAWDGQMLPVEVEMPMRSYLEGADLLILPDGTLGFRVQETDRVIALTDHYVRLPKNQISNFVHAIENSSVRFKLTVLPTHKRANLITRDTSLTNPSLNKTYGAVVNKTLGISPSSATMLMFSIGYIMPGLASLMTPALKKYGEKNLMLVAMGMSTLAGVLATAGGFWGMVEQMTLGPVQKGMFIAALLLMSGSSILKQLVSNMLIRANRGEVVLENVGKTAKKVKGETASLEKVNFSTLSTRVKEFFTKKSDVTLKDIVLYNLSFVYKNVGTLAFLASPYLINEAVRLTTGVNLGLDFSLSFPLFALYSAGVTWKVGRSKMRDAYSAKNLSQSQIALDKALNAAVDRLVKEGKDVSSQTIDAVSRSLKENMDDVSFAAIKLDTNLGKKDVYTKLKGEVLPSLENKLRENGLSSSRAKQLTKQIENSIRVQENIFGNMMKMLKAPGVLSLTSAMTLATVHEFVLSSSFAGAMKQMIPAGELGNFIIAATLYLPLIVGRLGGNMISKRISAGSMYLFCSALSGLGTMMMVGAGNSVPATIAGAAIASLGVGNFFTQMYDYIMKKYPAQNRELSSILALTMGIAGVMALPASYFGGVVAGADLWYAAACLGGSLLLTPGMMADSSFVKVAKAEWYNLKQAVKNFFKRGSNRGPNNLNNAAPIQ
jgi:hypothetical protein